MEKRWGGPLRRVPNHGVNLVRPDACRDEGGTFPPVIRR